MRRTILLILVLSLAAASNAFASASDVIRDCTDNGRLDGRYSQQELRKAIAKIPSDIDEYTNCRDIIRAAQLSGANGGGTNGTGGTDGTGGTGGADGGSGGPTGTSPGYFGGFSGIPDDPLEGATPEEQQAVAAAREDVPPPIGNRSATIAGSELPTPLWLVLALGAAGLIAFVAYDLRRRVVARRVA
jgi:hypothetical protein